MERSTDRHWDWLSGSLLFMLIQVASARLVTTNWATFLYFAEALAASGIIIGFALGLSRFGRRMIIGLTVAYTAFIVPWQITGAVSDKYLNDRLTHIYGILSVSLDQFMQRKPVHDPLFFVAFVCIVLWFISLAAGYWFARHDNLLVAILPSSVAIILIQIYDNYRSPGAWWLAVFLLILLLLLGREYYLESQKTWVNRRVFISEEAWSHIFSGLFGTMTAAVVIAWLIPTSLSSVQSANASWNKFTKPLIDRLSDAVTSLNGTYGRAGGNYYGSLLSLGRDAGQGDSPVFTVKVLNEPDVQTRYYWRGRVYDTYINGQWTDSPGSSLSFQPNGGDLQIADADGRSQAMFQFTNRFSSQSLIYAPSQPVWVDRPGKLIVTLTDSQQKDVINWEAVSALQAGGQYKARAEIADPNIQQLRSAGTLYPQWVTDRYLEVPEDVKAGIKDLADKVAGSQDDPYDKAQAITDYLRANITYTTSLPVLPDGRDPVLWMLFDYKKGFCNYYASAEVMMLRSVGIPARMAVGFAQGQYFNGEYIVRQRDAHAWPEVYFPGVGWVEFEPTVNQDALVRPTAPSQASGPPSGAIIPPRKPLGELEGQIPANTGSSNNDIATPFAQTIFGRALTIIAIILAAALTILLLRRYRVMTHIPVYISNTLEKGGITPPLWIDTWSRWNRSEPVERWFASINWSLNQFGKPQPMYVTPAERSRILKKLLPSAAKDIDALTDEFDTAMFTPRPPDLLRARRAGLSIIVHTFRTRLRNYLDALDGGDVYSG